MSERDCRQSQPQNTRAVRDDSRDNDAPNEEDSDNREGDTDGGGGVGGGEKLLMSMSISRNSKKLMII